MTSTPTSPELSSVGSSLSSVRAGSLASATQSSRPLDPTDTFVRRHIGPSGPEIAQMLEALGFASMESFVDATIPAPIRLKHELALGPARGEHELIEQLREIAARNRVFRSFIGMGYHGCVVPPVIQRNILENPGWYTQYTPYQAEISQGRLEALLNFQTMVADLTGLPLAGASLLDEATAGAEAMAMCLSIVGGKRNVFLVGKGCHPQTLGVVRTRADAIGVEVREVDATELDTIGDDVFAVLVQHPRTDGALVDWSGLAERVHDAGAMLIMSADLLALTLVTPPGELGADVAIGSAQRFGVPMGLGGPHAAYIATHERHARRMPGRIIGVSKDARGNTALRMAIQTREQHIKRERATSNICTAQALLAIMAGMYGVYHGPDGLRAIATRVHTAASVLGEGLRGLGHTIVNDDFFDTLRVRPGAGVTQWSVLDGATVRRMNLRAFDDGTVGIALDETVTRADLAALLEAFGAGEDAGAIVERLEGSVAPALPEWARRTSPFMTHEVFNTHHSETELLRYIVELQGRDLSLANSMIPLGSCTMKLNGTSEMLPVTWPEFGNIHPFAPGVQWTGYAELFDRLERTLAEITGLPGISLQPNSGAQGEYAGLMVIRAYHRSRGDEARDVCLIPESAHGTNPASAVMAGFRVVAVKCDATGAIDIDDLRTKATEHTERLGALMVTYPSTFGVFDRGIREICALVHEHGGQVYLDGANMNAQVGLTSPGAIGADVCHLNLHKTFCIPHGGGGPGMGPIGVAEHLRAFLPGHPVVAPAGTGEDAIGPIAGAPYGSASILTISWVYTELMGAVGLRRATEAAILSANYMAARLRGHYDVLFTGPGGRVAHEFIIDCRPFEKSAGVRIDDIAKRLMDYGFHCPTMSWPVPGTLMIEPTESESKDELDRFCDAMIAIREEIARVERGEWTREDNPLVHAPFTVEHATGSSWEHAFTREQAAYPAPWLRRRKFWAPVSRVDNAYGDRHLICSCPTVEELAEG